VGEEREKKKQEDDALVFKLGIQKKLVSLLVLLIYYVKITNSG
jgi:hypothetical protein